MTAFRSIHATCTMALANITWALLEVSGRDSFLITPGIWPLHWALQLSR